MTREFLYLDLNPHVAFVVFYLKLTSVREGTVAVMGIVPLEFVHVTRNLLEWIVKVRYFSLQNLEFKPI